MSACASKVFARSRFGSPMCDPRPFAPKRIASRWQSRQARTLMTIKRSSTRCLTGAVNEARRHLDCRRFDELFGRRDDVGSCQYDRAAKHRSLSARLHARQAENDVSIRDQKRQGEAHCQLRGDQLSETYVEPGASATNDRRPEFQSMLGAVMSKSAPFDVKIVHWRGSRRLRPPWSRNLH